MKKKVWFWVRPWAWGCLFGVLSGALVACGAVLTATPTPVPPPEALTGLETFADLKPDHTTAPVQYAQTPPAGGPHDPAWLNCGFYDQPVSNEQAVHSMEHGAVWITYRPDLTESDVTILRGLVAGKSHALLSPYPSLPAPVVASAWGVQLKLDGAADPRLPFFIEKYHNGPQTPEPGAPCSGGLGEPVAR